MAGPTARTIGDAAEHLALDHLVSRGLELVERNYRCRYGELDLVMLDGRCLVVVEVRCRKRSRFAGAAASIDRFKRRKLMRAAALFLGRHRELCDMPLRFDVVAVDGQTGGEYTLQWLRDAFRPREREF